MPKLEYVNADGVSRTLHYGDADRPELFGVETKVDVTQLIENNRALADEVVPGSMNKLLARVPLTIYEQSIHEGWDDGDWKKFLNDPDNKMFRVWPGKV